MVYELHEFLMNWKMFTGDTMGPRVLRNKDATHFIELNNFNSKVNKNLIKYSENLNKLKEAFESRFNEISLYG